MNSINSFDVNTMNLKELDQEFRRLRKRLFDIEFQIKWQKNLNPNLYPDLAMLWQSFHKPTKKSTFYS